MDIALWIVAGLLAVAYVAGGGGKIVIPKDKIYAFGATAHWVEDVSATTVKGIGVLEVLGAVGLILPAAVDVMPFLVPVAAGCLGLIMIGAALTRIRRREYRYLAGDLVYLGLLIFLAVGRSVGSTSFIA